MDITLKYHIQVNKNCKHCVCMNKKIMGTIKFDMSIIYVYEWQFNQPLKDECRMFVKPTKKLMNIE